MSTNGAKPYAGYPRVSEVGKRDKDKLRSPEMQAEAITGFAERGRIPVRMYEPEIDVSGSKPRRVILDTIIEAVERGELAGIIVAKLDRLSRLTPADRIELFDRIEKAGGVVLSATESNDVSTPEGRWVREIFLGLARMQWEKYREGLENAKAGAIAAGIPIARVAPFGYFKDEDKSSPTYRKLVPHPEEAPIVCEIYARRAAGESCPSIAKWLNELGVRTRNGSPWINPKVAALVRNRVYLGEVSYGSERANVEERYVNANAHTALVDAGTWHAAQKPHPRGRGGRPAGSSVSWLLKGLVRCQACGYVMLGGRDKRRPAKQAAYYCRGAQSGGQCPAPARIHCSVVEPIALAAFWERAEEAEALATLVTPESGRTALEEEVERWERSIEEWSSPETQEALGDIALWRDGLRKRRSEHERASAELGRLRAQEATTAAAALPPVAVLRERWREMSVEQHREALSLHLDCVAVTRDGTVAVFRRGSGPSVLPRNGRLSPTLTPIHVPNSAGVAAA